MNEDDSFWAYESQSLLSSSKQGKAVISTPALRRYYRGESCFDDGAPFDLMAPFRLQTWSTIFYLLFVGFPFALTCLIWCVVTFLVSYAMLLLFPLGIFLGTLSGYSWRYLAFTEVLTQYLVSLNETNKLRHYLPNMEPVPLVDASGDDSPWQRLVLHYKALAFDRYTWRSFVFFVVVNPAVKGALFVACLVPLSASFALLFNWALLAACDQCHGPLAHTLQAQHHTFLHWSLSTLQGALVTVPVGLVVLYLTCWLAAGLGALSRRLSFEMLGRPSHPWSFIN